MTRQGARPGMVFSPEWPIPRAGRHRPPGAPVGCFAGVILALVGPPPAQGSRSLLPSQLQLSSAERPHRGFCWVCVAKCSEKSRAPRLKREIPRFNDELKRKNFPRRADKDCFLARMASTECREAPRPPKEGFQPFCVSKID